MNLNRRLLYRRIAAITLWVLIILVVLVSLRSVNIVNRVGRIANNTLTLQNEQSISEVRDLARAFAVEWATWTGNSDSYTARLGAFISKAPNSITPPNAVQEVTSSAVVSTQKVDDDKYRVKVMLHTRKLTPVTEMSTISPALILVTQDDIKHPEQINSEKSNYQAWVDGLLCVEVLIKTTENGKPIVAGLPVIVASDNNKGEIERSGCTKFAPPELVTFVNQFLNLYYTNQSLSNFIVKGAKISPVAGEWKLETVKNVLVNNEKSPTKAFVEAVISAPGIVNLNQSIYLKIRPNNGSYLVEDVGSGIK